VLSLELSAGVLPIISSQENTVSSPLILVNNIDFCKDSVLCEWAYVIDFDLNTFEVYEGGNKTPLKKNARFYYDGFFAGSTWGNKYYPVCLKALWKLSNLPLDENFENLVLRGHMDAVETTRQKNKRLRDEKRRTDAIIEANKAEVAKVALARKLENIIDEERDRRFREMLEDSIPIPIRTL
jgi:hypothetical protein